jgi:hypothetical protein
MVGLGDADDDARVSFDPTDLRASIQPIVGRSATAKGAALRPSRAGGHFEPGGGR